jgi:hypothetical protein
VETTFHRWSDARDSLAERLNLPAGYDELDLFIDQVADALEHLTPSSRRQGLILRTWVVRDDDIDLTQHLSDGIVAAAASSFFSAGPTVPSITGSAVAVFRALRALYAKGVRLPPAEIMVLLHVKQFGPISTHELHEALRPVSGITREELRKILEKLNRVTVQDGSVVPMVERDGTKRWTTSC